MRSCTRDHCTSRCGQQRREPRSPQSRTRWRARPRLRSPKPPSHSLPYVFIPPPPPRAQLNCAALASLGAQLESLAGTPRTAVTAAAALLGAAAGSLALGGGRPSVGASGLVSGVAAGVARYHAAHAGLLPPESAAALRGVGERAAAMAAAYHLLMWSRLDVGCGGGVGCRGSHHAFPGAGEKQGCPAHATDRML